MTPITKEALELTKKFAAGAPCAVDFNNIESTMFWPHYEVIAKRMELPEVNVAVVKEYWFILHNDIVLKRFERGDLEFEKAYNCMVRAGEHDGKLFCFHGGLFICSITEQEAEIIKKHTPELRVHK